MTTPLLPDHGESDPPPSPASPARRSLTKQTTRNSTEQFFSTPDEIDDRDSGGRESIGGGNDDESLTEEDGRMQREFVLRHTLSYWVANSFILGSLMFMVGAAADILRVGPKAEEAFVTTEYIAGALCYAVGCYAGFLAVINLARKDPPPPGKAYHPFRFWAIMRTRRGWWATLSYTVGGIWFFAGTLCTGNAANVLYSAGSVCFIFGSALEVWTNDGFFHFRPRKLAFWMSWLDLVGSILFLAGSLAGFWEQRDLLDASFFVGCIFFLLSAIFGLWMWKLEQYGNTYLPGINAAAPSKVHAVRGYQLFFAVVYSVCIAFAVSGMSFSLQCAAGSRLKYQSYYQADISFQAFCIYFPLGLLALGSTLHIMPEGPPFSYLLWWFRVGSLFQLIVQIFDFAAGIQGFCEKMDDDGK